MYKQNMTALDNGSWKEMNGDVADHSHLWEGAELNEPS